MNKRCFLIEREIFSQESLFHFSFPLKGGKLICCFLRCHPVLFPFSYFKKLSFEFFLSLCVFFCNTLTGSSLEQGLPSIYTE